MKIYSHAVTNYIERVLNSERSQVSKSIESFAREQIKEAVRNPDVVYREHTHRPPIHIKNGCAVPVRDKEEKVVPTAYNSKTFEEKMKVHV